jgi:signal transduction histidine kinase
MAFRFPRRDEPLRISVLLLIAAGYFLAGKLGLLLAIPPGYATAIWPASGIALGSLLLWGNRYWGGVFLGSVLTNIAISYDGATSESIIRSTVLALSIGGGSALQAAFGARLVARFVRYPYVLNNEREVFRFFVFGGPITHLFSATWATSSLLVLDAIPSAALVSHWLTWWVGDTIGAMIFAPLVVMWCRSDAMRSSRRTFVTVPLLATFSVAVLLFVYSNETNEQQLQQRFSEDSQDLSTAITQRIDLNIETLQATAAFIAAEHSNRRAGATDLKSFTAPLILRRPELLSVAWAPQSAMDKPTFAIQTVTNGASEVGIDIAADAAQRERLATARSDNKPAVINIDSPINTPRNIIWVAVPTWANSSAIASARGEFLGYVLGRFNVSQLVANALHGQPLTGTIAVTFNDVTNPTAPVSIYRSASKESNSPTKALSLSNENQVAINPLRWQATFTPTLTYLLTHQRTNAWIVLAGGLLFTALIGAGSLLITGRAQSIETVVAQRTTELAQINEKLADEICDHLTTEHALEKERELLRTVVNNLYEGILVLDTAGQLQMANGVAYRMLHDVTGEELSELPGPTRLRQYAPDGITELMEEQTPIYCALRGQTVTDFEMVMQSHGRAPMTVVVNAQPLLTNDSERHGAIIVMRDITDTKAIERMKAEFVATVSHELRTPITSIRGSLGLIAGGATGPLEDKTRNLVEIALRNSDRLARLINDLLDMEKMETGKMQFEMQAQPLAALIEQAVEANSGYAQGFNVRYAIRSAPASINVITDSFRLLQVMSNLLSNAAKFSPAHSTVEINVKDGYVNGVAVARVEVTDKGPGIPAEFHARIFQKFSQADASDARIKSGTGLGLAICKTIIEQMHGKIGYETELGVGTTFYFEIPQAAPSTSANGSALAKLIVS